MLGLGPPVLEGAQRLAHIQAGIYVCHARSLHDATERATRLHAPATQVVYPTDSRAVLGFAAFGVEHPIHDCQAQLGAPGLASVGVVEVLKGGTERSTCPEAEFLSQSLFLR